MQKMITLTDIEALASKIKLVEEAYTARYQTKLLGILPYVGGGYEEHNALNDELGLPKQIEITPEIASFLAQDETEFRRLQEEAFFKKYPWKQFLIAPPSVLIAMINPSAAGFVFDNAKEAVAKLFEYQKEYQRIWSSRNQTIGPVMSAYLLTQPSSGTYKLVRAEWRRFYFSSGWQDEIGDHGIDRSVDVSKLPILPPSIPDSGV